MKKIVTLFFAIISSIGTPGQPQNASYDFTWGAWEFRTTRMIVTLDNGFVITGRISIGSSSFNSTVFKFDSAGNIQWARNLNINGSGYSRAEGIVQMADSSFYVVSSTNTFSINYMDFTITHLTPGGVPMSWHNYSYLDSTGLDNTDYANNISAAPDGNLVVSGVTRLQGSSTPNHAFILKTDTAGNILWTSMLDLPGSRFLNHYITSSGNIMAGGAVGSPEDFLYTLFDSTGNVIYSRTVGTVGFSITDVGIDLQPTPDGGMVMAGITILNGPSNPDNLVVKINSNGNVQWAKVFGTPYNDELISVKVLTDGSFLTTGSSFVNGTDRSVTFFKFDASGNLLWSRYFEIPLNNIYGYACIASPVDSSIFLAGHHNNGVTGTWTLYLSHIVDTAQNFCMTPFTVSINSVPTTTASFVAVQHPTFHNNFSFNILGSFMTLNASNLCIPTGINKNNGQLVFSLSPNPATSELRIQNSELKIERIEIYNALGEKVFQERLTSNVQRLTISVADFPSGIYFVKVKGEKGERTAKFVKK